MFGPALGVQEDFERTLRKVVKILDKNCPCLPLKRWEYEKAVRNPTRYQDIMNDELYFHGKVNARTGS